MILIRKCTCGKFLGIKYAGRLKPGISHGICKKCLKELYFEYEKNKLKKGDQNGD